LSKVDSLLDKAARSFDAAERLLADNHTDFAISRTFYGCFYVAEALLVDEGLSFTKHGAVIGEYGRLFARTGRLDTRFHRLLIDTFSLRQSADYGTGFDLDPDEASELIGEGRAFLDAAQSYLEGRRGDSG
jgi:uncharacterized protein (UPF0332 family)